jgi:phosphohistidine phosphatase
MKKQTLLIMRHAKSDWSANMEDFDRPLNRRGLKEAAKMGKWLRKQKIMPDRIVCSPAMRARQTIEIVCEQLRKHAPAITWDERIYEARLDDLLKVIAEHGKNAECVLLTGHNPGLDHLVNHLSKDSPPHTEVGKLMTTATIAILEFGEKGISDKQGSGKVIKLVRPKEI